MKDLKNFLTNQPLKEKFNSQFDLVEHAIDLATHRIKAGRVPNPKSDVKNFAYQILQDVLNEGDNFVDADTVNEAINQTDLRDTIIKEAGEKRSRYHDDF